MESVAEVGSGQAEAFAQLKPPCVSFRLHRALGQYVRIFLHCYGSWEIFEQMLLCINSLCVCLLITVV